jgi:hypothetical protein
VATGAVLPPRNTAHHRAAPIFLRQQEFPEMTISIAHLQPIVALIAGILILIMPRLLNFIVAAFLILTGILGLGLLR